MFNSTNWQYLRYKIEEKLQRLPIRKWINDNPLFSVGFIVLSVLLFILLLIAAITPNKAVSKKTLYKKAWFYDLNTKKLFAAKSKLLPPIDAPSGPLENKQPAGVRAYVFTYKNSESESEPEKIIGFLETFTPDAKKHLKKFPDAINTLTDGRLVKRPIDEKWYPADSEEGRYIISSCYSPNEKGQMPAFCYPD